MHPRDMHPRDVSTQDLPAVAQGVLEIQDEGFGFLRSGKANFRPSSQDVFVPLNMVRSLGLREGSYLEGPMGPPRRPGQNPVIREVHKVDGLRPDEARRVPDFKKLTSIDPDYQYELGDVDIDGSGKGDISLRVLDMFSPIGRGTRGLIVAPPRAGKTVLLQKVAKAMEIKYPDVKLMVLLIDERPEEGTDWKRATKGDVYLSTLDESAKHHIAVAEMVWKRAKRMVECGQEVVLLLDSITRLSRAYNAEIGSSGRTLTGGLDAKTMERPRSVMGSARNTEDAGSLTILGTTLVETGSRMDQLIFEEFKGTGNMELVLSRQLAERRIFPAFDLSMSGTRKEEKLISAARLQKINTLRRVLHRMKPLEAMETLVAKLAKTASNDEFLKSFTVEQ